MQCSGVLPSDMTKAKERANCSSGVVQSIRALELAPAETSSWTVALKGVRGLLVVSLRINT